MTVVKPTHAFGTLCTHCFKQVFEGTGFQPCIVTRLSRWGFKNCCHCGDEVYSDIYAHVELSKIGHPEFTRPGRPWRLPATRPRKRAKP